MRKAGDAQSPSPAPHAAQPQPQPQPLPQEDGARFEFEPRSLRLSLVYATLSFRLTVRNATQTAMPPAQLLGDLISAHAALPRDMQIGPLPRHLQPLREVPALAPGESRDLTCEVQIPLENVVPLERGSARFMVPLLRLVHIAADGTWQRLVLTVGLAGEKGVAPLRLDTGPQTFGADPLPLTASVIASGRYMPLDPVRAAG